MEPAGVKVLDVMVAETGQYFILHFTLLYLYT